MSVLNFSREDVLEAINQTNACGEAWLKDNHPGPAGRVGTVTNGFIEHEGQSYPAKALGRLAAKLAGHPLTDNPTTDAFRGHFQRLGFRLPRCPLDEEKQADERQKRLAETWSRPRQAEFRRAVFDLYGHACVVSDCSILEAIEAAHIVPVSSGGSDDGTNGLPLRSDLHRLFDAGILSINAEGWTVEVSEQAHPDYAKFSGSSIRKKVEASGCEAGLRSALCRRGFKTG